jgi:hypothetical protein
MSSHEIPGAADGAVDGAGGSAVDGGGGLQPSGPGRRVLGFAVAGALAAAAIWWAAFPVSGGSGGTRVTLVVAIVTGAMSVAQLALAGTVTRRPDTFAAADRIAQQLGSLITMLPWAEIMTVAALVLEVLHRSRPWHTAVLAVALTGYLLAVHLAETDAHGSTLRAQLPLLSSGLGLTALSVGAVALPGLPVGPIASLIRIAAVVLAAVAAGLAVPVWLRRGRGG